MNWLTSRNTLLEHESRLSRTNGMTSRECGEHNIDSTTTLITKTLNVMLRESHSFPQEYTIQQVENYQKCSTTILISCLCVAFEEND